METWHVVTMDNRDISAHKHMQLQNAFAESFLAGGGPRDAAMFGDLEATGHHFYFSPGAVKLARLLLLSTYAAVPCKRPPGDAVALLVGEESAAWSLVRD